jgi:hypothetical protein
VLVVSQKMVAGGMMMSQVSLALSGAVLACLISAGCGLDQECPDDRFVTGVIDSFFDGSPNQVDYYLSDAQASWSSGTGRFRVHVSRSASIVLVRVDGSLGAGELDDLVVGARVRACVGPGMERSLPPGVSSNKVVVLSSPMVR